MGILKLRIYKNGHVDVEVIKGGIFPLGWIQTSFARALGLIAKYNVATRREKNAG